MKSKIGILSLGCPRNLVDSELILGRLKKKGHEIVDIHKADVAIVNTCAFINDAKAESIDSILDLIELKKEGKLKKVIACGCLVERYKQELKKELPEIDAFIGRVSLNHTKERFPITEKHYAYLKICEGCLSSCSFCVIPKIKGKFTSSDMESLVLKAKEFDKEGISELNIIGQDTANYGVDLYGKKQLPVLMKKTLKATKHIGWLRVLYLYPDLKIVDSLLDLMNKESRICKYIDLPVQHINNRILKLMNRKNTKEDILKIIDRIRTKAPNAAIRTSLIVGMPSETEKEFNELVDFVKDVRFERLGVFTYSREEQTPAFSFKKQLPQKVKAARLDYLMKLQQEISADINSTLIGKEIDVLIESKEGKDYLGRSQFDAPEVDGIVFVKSKKELKQGQFVKAKITGSLEYDLIAEV